MTNLKPASLPRPAARLTGSGWLYAFSIAAILAAAVGAFLKFDPPAAQMHAVQQHDRTLR